MNDSDHASRLVVWREQLEDQSLFAETDEDFNRYRAVITNVSKKEMSTEDVFHHHMGGCNAERFTGEAQSGLGLRQLPYSQEQANRICFGAGMPTTGLLKLMR